MQDFYSSFQPNSFHMRQTVIEVLTVVLANEDMNTIQKFSYSVQTSMGLCMMTEKCYKFTYIEDEEEGSFL